MGRFDHSPGQQSQPVGDPVRIAELQAEIDAADAEHRELLNADASDYAHLRRLHLAERKFWSLCAKKHHFEGNHDAARKASATANEHSAMAHKLEQNSSMDRLAELERELKAARSNASKLARLA